jgi:predicted ester cyclase
MKYDNKKIVRKYIEEVLNTGDADRTPEFVSSEYTEVFDNKKYPVGIEGAKDHILGVRETYPDIHMKIDFQIAEADWVATSYVMSGTHSGTWMGIKPTNKKIEVTGVNLDRLVDGKIVEHGGAANLFTALLDIGAITLVKE